MQVPLGARRIGAACLTLLALGAPAAGASTADTRDTAVANGVTWLRTQQDTATGAISGFGGDYALSALAAAGVHPADVHGAGAGDPSAQDYYAGTFAGLTTPSSTAVLFGTAAGIDTQRLSAATNLVAFLASAYNPDGSFGNGATNVAAFTTLGLARVGAPAGVLARAQAYLRSQQHTDGGWNFSKVADETARATASGVDTTGTVLAALCETGATAADPDVRTGLNYLRGKQDPATGGWGNTDSTAWALSGLNACGVAAEGGRFTTSSGASPVDALLADQLPSGAWPFSGTANLYSTQNAVRALAGEGFSADPPRRAVAADPRLRAPATVAAGTVTPHALAIDDGIGGVRFCRVDVASGATLAAVLTAAQTASTPAGCVTASEVDGGVVSSVNGAAGTWRLEVDKHAAEAASATRVIAFGDTVGLTRTVVPTAGPQGPTGPTGPTGADGGAASQGPAGPTGPAGADGTPGPTGAAGPKGDAGVAGPAGSKGDAGAGGPAGAKGDTGAAGPSGAKGDRGAKGARGKRGRTLRCDVRSDGKVRCKAVTAVGRAAGRQLRALR